MMKTMKTKEDLINFFEEENENVKKDYLEHVKFLRCKTEYQKKTLLKYFLTTDSISQKWINKINKLDENIIENLIYEYEINHEFIFKRVFFTEMIKALTAYEFTKIHIRVDKQDEDMKHFQRDNKRIINDFVQNVQKGYFDDKQTIQIPLSRSKITSILFHNLKEYYTKKDINKLKDTIKNLFDVKRINTYEEEKLTKEEINKYNEEYKKTHTLDLSDPTI